MPHAWTTLSRHTRRTAIALALAVPMLAVGAGAGPERSVEAAAAACPTAPTFAHTGTAFGTHLSTRTQTYQDAFATQDAKYTRMDAVRIFDGGVPPDNAWKRRADYVSGRTVVTSFRMPPQEVLAGSHDSAILHFFRTAPSDARILWSYYHEPEPHIVDGSFSFSQYRAAWQRLSRLAAQVCKPNLYPTLILTGWTTDPKSKRNWRDYYAGDDYISVLAFDPYNSASRTPTEYTLPRFLFSHVVEAAKSSGKPWGIAETGSQRIDATGEGRADWLKRTAGYFKHHRAAFVTYYDSIGSKGPDYRLLDSPSLDAWRTVVRDY